MERDVQARALDLLRRGYRCQMEGALDDAIALYHRSIDAFPTAEAHTFLGWSYSFQGRIDEAIEECKRAIEVDPSFGNPYNDIGAYLIDKGDLDGAIPWLEQAKQAPRYEPRHFPFLNLGRAFARKGLLGRALIEFRAALELDPRNPIARTAVDELGARLN